MNTYWKITLNAYILSAYMIQSAFIVGAGSFLGGAMRYMVSMLVSNHSDSAFPWGTLAVNLAGCLLIGILYGIFERHGMCHSSWCMLLTTGFCGGFTTFSTFSRESLLLFQSGNILGMVAYIILSVCIGLLLVAAGWAIAK